MNQKIKFLMEKERMMRKMKKMSLMMVILLSLLVGCNQRSPDKLSQVRGNILVGEKLTKALDGVLLESTNHRGGLESKDLQDEWIFGLTITNTNNFFGKVLTAHSKAKVVKMIPYQGKLYIYDILERKVVMNLDMEKQNGIELVDFASALDNRQIKEALKVDTRMQTGVSTYESYGRSKVLGTTIKEDMVLIDLRYPMVGVMQAGEKSLRKEGTVDLRLFLVKRDSVGRVRTRRTVADSLRDHYGYFGPDLMRESEGTPIRTFSLENNSITFHLKDFPTDMIPSAKEAILAWNKAFDGSPIKVELAGPHVDIGDPRYNVVKWVKNTDKHVGWAGVAVPVFADPETGSIVSGSLLINGDFLRNDYKKRHGYSIQAFNQLKAKFGSLDIFSEHGEVPVIPQFTGLGSFDEYIKGYYRETISHEVGHVLGLRHNFKGTVNARHGLTNSVMDYLPRKERALFHGIGGYDIGAIRYAYYGERENTEFPFCTDDHLMEQYNCSQGDVGNSVAHTFKALEDGLKAVSETPLKTQDGGTLGPINSVLMNGLKISRLSHQIESYEMRRFVDSAQFKGALNKICKVKPARGLDHFETSIVENNIRTLKSGLVKRILGLKGYPGSGYGSLFNDTIDHLLEEDLLGCFFE